MTHSYGADRLRRFQEHLRIRELSRIASVGDGVHIHKTADLRGRLDRLVLGESVDIRRYASLRIEAPDAELTIGAYSSVRDFCIIRTQQGRIDIGSHVSLNPFCLVHGEGTIRIGNDVRIGPRVTILSSTHPFADPWTPIRLQGTPPLPVVIDDDVWIGNGATILGGVTIGNGSVIAAGAVVTENVEPLSIAGGVPARRIGTRGDDGS